MKVEELKKAVEERCPTEYRFVCTPVIKEGNTKVTGVGYVKTDGIQIRPVVYLEDFLQQSNTIEETSNRIAALLLQTPPKGSESWTDSTSYEKERIRLKLINYELNAEYLEHVLHRRFHEFALVPYITLDSAQEGDIIASVVIRDELLPQLEYTEDKVFEFAEENMRMYFQPKVSLLPSILEEQLPKDAVESITPILECYVIGYGDDTGLYGACALFFREVLQKLARDLKTDFYIIPSSIYEILCIPVGMDLNPCELIKMMREVNDSCVEERIQLGQDSVYLYERTKDTLTQIQSSEV